MPQTVYCNHYQAMSEHTVCKAGVTYATMAGVPFDRRPCFAKRGEPPRPGCDLVQLPTHEELAERDAYQQRRFEEIGRARAAIVAALGGPWKRGTPGAAGQIPCPVCDGGALSFERARSNGHILARCSTDKCVGWIE